MLFFKTNKGIGSWVMLLSFLTCTSNDMADLLGVIMGLNVVIELKIQLLQ